MVVVANNVTMPAFMQLFHNGREQRLVRRAVIATVAYFDVHDMALTSWEVYHWLWHGELSATPPLHEVRRALQVLADEGILEYSEGMYCYRGRQCTVAIRKARQAVAARKWRKARRMAMLLAWVPYVRMVAVSNSLAWDNVHEQSDLDFFVIAEAGHLWTARAWATAVMALLRRRPRLGHTRDMVCLNFWAAPHAALRRVCLTEDIYFAYWLASVRPLYGADSARQTVASTNHWLHERIATPYASQRRSDHAVRIPRMAGWVKRGLEAMQASGRFERFLERLERGIMPTIIADKAHEPSSHVVLEKDMLKFHLNDRRAEIRDKWRVRVREWNNDVT